MTETTTPDPEGTGSLPEPSWRDLHKAADEPTSRRQLAPRERPRLLVAVDGSVGSQRRLVWALQEAARREATVLAVAVLDADEDHRVAARTLLHAQLRSAVEATGVRGRGETALLEPSVFRALTAAVRGTDFVVVGPHGKTMLRPAVPRPRRAFPRSG